VIKRNRKLFFAAFGGVLISFCYTAGASLDQFDSLDLKDMGFYGKWLAAAVLAAVILFFLWEELDRLKERQFFSKPFKIPVISRITSRIRLSDRAAFWISMLFLLLSWLPALFSLFPGAFAYDACEEWSQVHAGAITSHHPVIHVLMLGGLVEGFFHLTGSYNVGIAVYTILQMLLLSWMFSLTLQMLKEYKVPGVFRLLTLLFYAWSPVIQLFAISATKDVLFTGAELLFFLYTLRFCLNRNALPNEKKELLGFCISGFCTMILRNNGVYIVLGTLVILAAAYVKKQRAQQKKPTILPADTLVPGTVMPHTKMPRTFMPGILMLGTLVLGILMPYVLYVGPVYSLFQVEPGGVEEMLSVPLQQMARVHRYDYDSLSREDLELLYQVVDKEALTQYRATVSDFVKLGFQRQAFEEKKSEFFKLWVRWGISHPLTYLNSILINTVDAWYPHAVVDGYRHGDGRSSYFDYQVDTPGTEIVLLPRLHDFYEHLSHDADAQTAPLAFLVLSPGWYLVTSLVIFFYFWRGKQYGLLLPGVLLLLHFATVLLGPMALVRYMLIFYYGFPVFLSMALFGDHFEA